MAARAAAALSTNRRVSISTSLARGWLLPLPRRSHYPPGSLANEETAPPPSRGVQPVFRRIVRRGCAGRPAGVPPVTRPTGALRAAVESPGFGPSFFVFEFAARQPFPIV